MRSKIIIVAIALFSLAVAYAAYAFFMRSQTAIQPIEVPAVLPTDIVATTSPDLAVPTDAQLTIQGMGGLVKVNNFYTNARQVTDSTVTLSATMDYEISYARDNHVFTLLLLPDTKTHYNEYRTSSEAEFLSALGIDKATACLLHVNVAVPEDYSQSLDLHVPLSSRLSFCSKGSNLNL